MKEREGAMSDANEFEDAITRALDRKPRYGCRRILRQR